MKTENLTKAFHAAQFSVNDIRAAHADAISADNQFAEIVLLDILEMAIAMESKLICALYAAKPHDTRE